MTKRTVVGVILRHTTLNYCGGSRCLQMFQNSSIFQIRRKNNFLKVTKGPGTLLPIPPAGHAKVLVSDIIHVHVVPGNSSWYTWQIKVWVLNAWVFSVKMGSWTIKWKIAYTPYFPGRRRVGVSMLCVPRTSKWPSRAIEPPTRLFSPSKVETFYTMPYDVSRINARALLRDVFRQRWMFYKEGDKDKRNRLAFLVLLNRPLDNR